MNPWGIRRESFTRKGMSRMRELLGFCSALDLLYTLLLMAAILAVILAVPILFQAAH
jgi:hypothetical protein